MIDPKEIEAAHAANAQEVARRERDRAAVFVVKSDKKTVKGRMDAILENPLLEIAVNERNIPAGAIRSAAIEGLVEVQVHGTHLSLLGPADPHQAITVEQRVAMARRLLEVGPFLPRYIKRIQFAVGKATAEAGITAEEVTESAAIADEQVERRAKAETTFTPAPTTLAKPRAGDPGVKAADLMPKTQHEAGVLQRISMKGLGDDTAVALSEGRTRITAGSLRRKALELIKAAGGTMTIGALTAPLGEPAKPVVAKLLEAGWVVIAEQKAQAVKPSAAAKPSAAKARAKPAAKKKGKRK